MQSIANAGDVYTFKLNSGEELIAKTVQCTPDWIIIDSPVSVAPGPQGLGLVPSMFTVAQDTEIKLNTATITLCALTDDSVKMKYIEATTGIRVPEKKIVMG